MLAKSARLSRVQFTQYFKVGRRYHSPYFTVLHTPLPQFHGAVVVGKKVHKKAVARNRLRRQIYGALYRYKTTHSVTGVYIIIAKPAVKTLPQTAIAPAVVHLLELVHGSYTQASTKGGE